MSVMDTLPTMLPGLAVGLAAGVAMGGLYFVALWASVSRLATRPPGPWFVAGLLARLAVAVAVLTLVGHWGGGPALAGALTGFVLVRAVLLRRARAPVDDRGRRT